MRAAVIILFCGCVAPPSLEVDDAPQVGFDAPFELVARATPGARVSWRQVGGAAIPVEVSRDGLTLRGRTPALSQPLAWGVAPISAANAGELSFEVVADGGGIATRKLARVTAAARSPGLSSVAVGHRLHLGGRGWRIVDRPRGSSANVIAETLLVDAPGRWKLTDGDGKVLELRAGRYDETPLDCGRAECHPRASSAAAQSPMTHVLKNGLAGAYANYSTECALGCHTVGEPGLADGGFLDVMRALDFKLPSRISWGALPPPLRRVGGVGCTACHGPGAIPERSGRWAILRADVCAVCHDAPPRYTDVADWRMTKMAHADADPRAREGECARCHTTVGFLASLGIHSLSGDWCVPEPIGLGCAVCHEPHGNSNKALLREPQICARCHGENVSRDHLTPNGCDECHRGGHRFSVEESSCARCHREPPRGRVHTTTACMR